MVLETANFYTKKRKYWLRFYHSMVDNKQVQRLMTEKYVKPEKYEEIKLKIQKDFEEVLPQIPDFGNKNINQFTLDMIKTVLSFIFYRNLKVEGFQTRTIGQILYEIAEIYYSTLNPVVKYIMRKNLLSTKRIKKAKQKFEERKKWVDPEDYIGEFIEGDNENLLCGLNYINCPGLNFLRRQNALEIAPYLCLCDYPMFRGLNIGFNRDQNLAIGGSMCTFRIYRNYATQKGWPPEEVDEYKNFKFS